MDIIIGKTEPIQFNNRPDLSSKKEMDIPARILHVRRARSRKNRSWQEEGKERRDTGQHADPVNARVLLLLIPDGSRLPSDLTDGNYRFRLRIIPEKDEPSESKPSPVSKKGFSQRV